MPDSNGDATESEKMMNFEKLNVIKELNILDRLLQHSWDWSVLIGYKQTRLQIIYVTKSAAIGTAELEIKCFDKNVF